MVPPSRNVDVHDQGLKPREFYPFRWQHKDKDEEVLQLAPLKVEPPAEETTTYASKGVMSDIGKGLCKEYNTRVVG
jgi:hypothetical protein